MSIGHAGKGRIKMIQRVAMSLSVIIGLTTAACGPSQKFVPPDQEELSRRVREAAAKTDQVRADNEKAEDAAKRAALDSTSSAIASTDEYNGGGEADSEGSALCWQDYCPCDAPETVLDRTICRNAKGGIDMSDDQWAIGAQARDSKREGDRLNAEMDNIISDMRTQ